MTPALLLTTLLLAAPSKGRSSPNHLEAGQRQFRKGDFSGALKSLELAASDAGDPQTLARVHLLRGQAYAAQQDFSRAEEAFGLALEADPMAALDPARVDPAVVKMLDGLRSRLSGELAVRTAEPGVRVMLDGKLLGVTPLRSTVGIGLHLLEAKSADGKLGAKQEVIVRSGRATEIDVQLKELPEESNVNAPQPTEQERRPFADLRGTLDPFQLDEGLGIEVGGGLAFTYYRASVHARVFPEFGLTLRGALAVPVAEKLTAHVEVETPALFLSSIAIGLGGAGGVEYLPSKWLGLFFQVGARQYFTGPTGYARSRVTTEAGVRLRLP
ncbi:MAG: PEGA domain-containing protein [Myxococcota bacterium]